MAPKTVLLSIVATAHALAAPLTIQNPSFEAANLVIITPEGNFSNLIPSSIPTGGTLANWVAFGLAGDRVGAFDPSQGGVNWSFVWETGKNVGYAQTFGFESNQAVLSQVLGDVLTAHTTYTLQVDIGRAVHRPCLCGITLWSYGQVGRGLVRHSVCPQWQETHGKLKRW